MGEAHKIGDSIKSPSISDANPAGPIDIIQMWQQDRASQKKDVLGNSLFRKN